MNANTTIKPAQQDHAGSCCGGSNAAAKPEHAPAAAAAVNPPSEAPKADTKPAGRSGCCCGH